VEVRAGDETITRDVTLLPDVDGSGRVDFGELALVATEFGKSPPDDPRADWDRNGRVDVMDLVRVGLRFGQTSSPWPPGELLLAEVVSAADGGKVASPDGKITLEIPPGALPRDTRVTVRVVPPGEWTENVQALGPRGPVYSVEPDGLKLNKPAKLTLRLDPEDLAGLDLTKGYPYFMLFSRWADGTWEPVFRTTTEVNLTTGEVAVTGDITHFSQWYDKDWLFGGFFLLIDPPEVRGEVGLVPDNAWMALVGLYNAWRDMDISVGMRYWGDGSVDVFQPGPSPLVIKSDTKEVADPPPLYFCIEPGRGRYGVTARYEPYFSLEDFFLAFLGMQTHAAKKGEIFEELWQDWYESKMQGLPAGDPPITLKVWGEAECTGTGRAFFVTPPISVLEEGDIPHKITSQESAVTSDGSRAVGLKENTASGSEGSTLLLMSTNPGIIATIPLVRYGSYLNLIDDNHGLVVDQNPTSSIERDLVFFTLDPFEITSRLTLPMDFGPDGLAVSGNTVYMGDERWIPGKGRTKVVLSLDLNTLTFSETGGELPLDGIAFIAAGGDKVVVVEGFAGWYLPGPQRVAILDARTLEVKNILTLESPWYTAVTPDGARAVISNTDVSTVTVVDLQNGSVLATIPVGRKPEGVAIMGDLALVANREDGTLSVIDLNTLKVVQTIAVGPNPRQVSAGGNTVLVSVNDYEGRAEFAVLRRQ
jgi:YVTN family beta-propeller protein